MSEKDTWTACLVTLLLAAAVVRACAQVTAAGQPREGATAAGPGTPPPS
ncbi:hypothetical protein HTV80_29805 [Streptomyces sp. Vc74B-19]|nr:MULTISPECIES: hypothetical protein [unclassified Streptomyces]MBT3167257.1 hypothetical protein [Streptomyces sp. Vc74B-19]MDU0300651.1 hypothetical protein [Streptomyces sp. PAL114]